MQQVLSTSVIRITGPSTLFSYQLRVLSNGTIFRLLPIPSSFGLLRCVAIDMAQYAYGLLRVTLGSDSRECAFHGKAENLWYQRQRINTTRGLLLSFPVALLLFWTALRHPSSLILKQLPSHPSESFSSWPTAMIHDSAGSSLASLLNGNEEDWQFLPLRRPANDVLTFIKRSCHKEILTSDRVFSAVSIMAFTGSAVPPCRLWSCRSQDGLRIYS
ncbi:uncharacterized protein ARMOST_21860 [Armillaria ostoyae]|uniref:Uncharacterized protein n=1 Tax=Armillaria ostoyae TaxID=47428 RepID=A0A284SBA6_ARMOS|nr:uncharacterized protein ARMOST_21860 [Armillaria ostoyae]